MQEYKSGFQYQIPGLDHLQRACSTYDWVCQSCLKNTITKRVWLRVESFLSLHMQAVHHCRVVKTYSTLCKVSWQQSTGQSRLLPSRPHGWLWTAAHHHWPVAQKCPSTLPGQEKTRTTNHSILAINAYPFNGTKKSKLHKSDWGTMNVIGPIILQSHNLREWHY